mmetsp:Transcript_41269/g.81408  ORF Transcript_41269/g.81408 Transcript_41269/m.81408 type:complete len:201 (-) Transcript_41269:621-1223(-)
MMQIGLPSPALPPLPHVHQSCLWRFYGSILFDLGLSLLVGLCGSVRLDRPRSRFSSSNTHSLSCDIVMNLSCSQGRHGFPSCERTGQAYRVPSLSLFSPSPLILLLQARPLVALKPDEMHACPCTRTQQPVGKAPSFSLSVSLSLSTDSRSSLPFCLSLFTPPRTCTLCMSSPSTRSINTLVTHKSTRVRLHVALICIQL